VGNDQARRSSNQAELRRRAEEIVRRKAAQSSEDLSPEETRHELHELRVHQIELEMQNEELLQTSGHEVAVAHNGPDGSPRRVPSRPEVVLCDIGLPGMDGFAVAQAFRADEALREIGLVAVSGYALPEDVATAKAAGFDKHLAKPASLEQINHTIARVLAKGDGTAPSAQ